MKRFVLALGALLVAAVLNAAAQKGLMPTEWSEPPQAHDAALKGLKILARLVDSGARKQLGIAEGVNLSGAVLGSAVPVYSVRADRLKEYSSQSDPFQLLSFSFQIVYPIEVKSVAQAAITVEQAANEWKATSYGFPVFARMVARATEVHIKALGLSSHPASTVFLVHVPVYETYFIASAKPFASSAPGGVPDFPMFPLGNDPALSSDPGAETGSARQLFSILSNKIKSLPNAPS